MKKRSGPNTDPCGTPASIFFKEELRPFRTTFWFRFFSVVFQDIINFPSTSYVFNLKISPSCQTLLKALEICRNTPFLSSGGLQSNDLWTFWVINSSCEIQESPGIKPD